VIEVERRRGLGPLERLHVPTLVRALWIPSRHLLRNLWARLRGRDDFAFTAPLPRAHDRLRPGARGMPVLIVADDGAPRCVACGLCAFACPSRCIRVESSSAQAPGGRPRPHRFEIDMARCLFCGLCQEACPEEAIVMSPLIAPASAERGSLVYDLDRLLVDACLVETEIGWLRSSRADEAGP
jgi:NADH-quinone oxidoreductase subunit I